MDVLGKSVEILNPQVIENLGQINLLLSDKTGTLTQGKMKLKKIFLDGREFAVNIPEDAGTENTSISKNKQKAAA